MQSRQRFGHRAGLRPALAQQRHGLAVGGFWEAFLNQCGQHAARPELQEGGRALGPQPTGTVQEAHRAARLPYPVLGGAQLLGGGRLTGQIGDHLQLRRGVAQPLGDVTQAGQHGVHPG